MRIRNKLAREKGLTLKEDKFGKVELSNRYICMHIYVNVVYGLTVVCMQFGLFM